MEKFIKSKKKTQTKPENVINTQAWLFHSVHLEYLT